MEDNCCPPFDDTVCEVPDWFKRLNDEGLRITSDLKKLDNFISSQAYRDLPADEQEMLRQQRFGMSLYQDAVRKRFDFYNQKYRIVAHHVV